MSIKTFLALLALLLLRPQLFCQEPVIRARCIGVHDGDTITVLVEDSQQLRIRLTWIDSPEMGQAFGYRAKQAMSQLVFGKDVELRPHTTDRYGRTVAMVFVGGTDAGLELVKEGLAWCFVRYLPEASVEVQQSYQQAEIEAREQRRGLWQQENPPPIPPWEYRHPQRSLPSSGEHLNFPRQAWPV
jgi:endonuclease YncB( thermonuclease family)